MDGTTSAPMFSIAGAKREAFGPSAKYSRQPEESTTLGPAACDVGGRSRTPRDRLDTIVFVAPDRCVDPARESAHRAHLADGNELKGLADNEGLELVAWAPVECFAYPSGNDDLEFG